MIRLGILLIIALILVWNNASDVYLVGSYGLIVGYILRAVGDYPPQGIPRFQYGWQHPQRIETINGGGYVYLVNAYYDTALKCYVYWAHTGDSSKCFPIPEQFLIEE